jgi:leucyl aminopeptidase (aminopeptidase T)
VADLARAVETVIRRCLAVAAGEEVLVIADETRRELGEALADEARRAGGETVLALMAPREIDGTEPPAAIAAAWPACDVYLAPTEASLSHTKARKAATDAGARGATLPHVTADLLARLMDVDFDAMAGRCRRVADVLTAGTEARLNCPLGTDLRVDLRGRDAIPDDGDLTARGAFGNLPCGEGFIAPAGGEGQLVASSIASIGLCSEPAILTVAGGRIAAATGLEGEELLLRLSAHGDDGRNLAELGVGTNERAGLTGNILEDEKIIGSAHIAFGASAGIGGTVAVPIHLDCVILDVTLDVDGTRVVEDGKLVL